MRTWREVRNLASQKFPLTSESSQSRLSESIVLLFFNADHCWVRNVKDMSKNMF